MEMAPLSQPGPLTEMDRFVFECFGYLVIPDVLSPAECDEALAASRRVHEGYEPGKFRQVGRGFEKEPSLERLIDHPAILPKVRGLLGDRFVLHRLKPLLEMLIFLMVNERCTFATLVRCI